MMAIFLNTQNGNNESSWFKSMVPSSIILPIVLSVACVLSILTIYFWKCINKRKRKEAQLLAMTPKSTNSHSYAGIIADHPIEFVVPTITVNETHFTEDSVSDSDYQSTHSNYSSDREIKRQIARFQINPNDIRKGLYESEKDANNNDMFIVFVLHYSYLRQQLLVTLLSAKNLPQKRQNMFPFAKITLLPDKSPKFVTKVQKGNNPTFNELFTFPIARSGLNERKLKITLWNSDSFSRKSFIGQCNFPLKQAGIHNDVNNDVITEDISCKLGSVS